MNTSDCNCGRDERRDAIAVAQAPFLALADELAELSYGMSDAESDIARVEAGWIIADRIRRAAAES